MTKIVKWIGIGAAAAVILVAVAVVVFLSTFDINDYRERIARAVHDETGRTLVFDEDLSLTVFPSLGVEMGRVSLSNAEGFGPQPMLQVLGAKVNVKLIPLLRGQIRFGMLDIDGLTVRLKRDAGGRANWDDLTGREDAPVAEESSADKSFSLEIEGVDISDANLVWDDRRDDRKFLLRGLNLKTGRIFRGAPFPVDVRLDFECSRPDARGTLTLSGKSSVDFQAREYGHMDMKLAVEAQGADVPGGKGRVEAALQLLAANFSRETVQVTGLTVAGYGMTVHCDGTVQGVMDGLKKAVATFKAEPFDAKKTLAALGMDVPQTGDPAALTALGGMAEVNYAPGDLHVPSLELHCDGARIAGRLRIREADDEPFYFVRLDADKLDLDRYLPLDRPEGAAAEEPEDDRILFTEVLKNLYLDAEAKVAEFKVEGMRMQNVAVSAKARHGLVRISPVSADAYSGKLSSGLTINAMGVRPKMDFLLGIDKVQVGPLARDVTGDESYAGLAEVNGAFACEGEKVSTMLQTLNGKATFSLTDGVFPGVDLLGLARSAHDSRDRKGETLEGSGKDRTSFGSITGTVVAVNGLLRNRDLEVKAPGLRATGEGVVSLPAREIDYIARVKLVPTGKGQGGADSGDLYGIMVPIHVTGPLDHPRYWVSVSEYIKSLGGAVIGTVGNVVGGVKNVLKGMGQAIDKSCCEEDGEPEEQKKPEKKGLFGIF